MQNASYQNQTIIINSRRHDKCRGSRRYFGNYSSRNLSCFHDIYHCFAKLFVSKTNDRACNLGENIE